MDEVIEASAAAAPAYFGGLAGASVVRQRADVDRSAAGAEKVRDEGAGQHGGIIEGKKPRRECRRAIRGAYMSIPSFNSSAMEIGLPFASVQPTMCITG